MKTVLMATTLFSFVAATQLSGASEAASTSNNHVGPHKKISINELAAALAISAIIDENTGMVEIRMTGLDHLSVPVDCYTVPGYIRIRLIDSAGVTELDRRSLFLDFSHNRSRSRLTPRPLYIEPGFFYGYRVPIWELLPDLWSAIKKVYAAKDKKTLNQFKLKYQLVFSLFLSDRLDLPEQVGLGLKSDQTIIQFDARTVGSLMELEKKAQQSTKNKPAGSVLVKEGGNDLFSFYFLEGGETSPYAVHRVQLHRFRRFVNDLSIYIRQGERAFDPTVAHAPRLYLGDEAKLDDKRKLLVEVKDRLRDMEIKNLRNQLVEQGDDDDDDDDDDDEW